METFVLLWNPKKFLWDAYENGTMAHAISTAGHYRHAWSTGSRHQGITPGDRIFLLKTGTPPRGIVAAGIADSSVEFAPHWDAHNPHEAPYVDVTWTEIVDAEHVLPQALLARSIFPHRVMAGGLQLDARRAAELETLWASHTAEILEHTPTVTLRGRSVTRTMILSVLQQYRDLTAPVFLQTYGFAPSTSYKLEHDDQLYDSKAILGVAAGLTAHDFSGGLETTSRLRKLGFAIRSIDAPDVPAPDSSQRPPFHQRDTSLELRPITYTRDPDTSVRGWIAHRGLENFLAQLARDEGLEPIDPSESDPRFDLAWTGPQGMTVVEVKSLPTNNESAQIRLGLGQVLEYAYLLSSPNLSIRPVLFVERQPDEPHWEAVCAAAHVTLWWPGHHPNLHW